MARTGKPMLGKSAALAALLMLAEYAAPPPAVAQDAATKPAATQASTTYAAPARRRIYLMRHGDVTYFDAQGKPVPDPDAVTLNETGKVQSDAAGRYFVGLGIKKFDRVITSNLARTIETADRVLAAGQIEGKPQQIATLREIKSGGASRTAPAAELPSVFLGFTQAQVAADTKFIGGETAGEMQQRVVAGFETLLQDKDWDTALVVLHGIVNNALLSRALTGKADYFGHFEASSGCIHILDAGPTWDDWVVRAFNLCPDPASYGGARLSVLEKLLLQALKGRH